MSIDVNYTTAGLPVNIPVSGAVDDTFNGLFAGYLAGQMAVSQPAEADPETQQNDESKGDIAVIKEKGLVAYIMELHEKRIREEILESLGLTEEDLAEMSPEERAATEKLIAEETRKRLAAEALMNNDDKEMAGRRRLEEIVMGPGAASFLEEEETENPDSLKDRETDEKEPSFF